MNCSTAFGFTLAIAFVAALAVAPARGQEGSGDRAPAPSLDELLDVGDADGSSAAAEAGEPGGTAGGGDPATALREAARAMAEAAAQLGEEADAGLRTQRAQDRALRRLEQVIAAARRQQSSGGGGGASPT